MGENWNMGMRNRREITKRKNKETKKRKCNTSNSFPNYWQCRTSFLQRSNEVG
jgi:hypothetical protein